MTDWEYVGDLCVDSGQMMLCDPCYIKEDFENEYGDTGPGMSYSGACAATLSKNGCGFLTSSIGQHSVNLAFATSSGHGDGLYPVFIKRDGGRIAAMKIEFIGDEDEEDDC